MLITHVTTHIWLYIIMYLIYNHTCDSVCVCVCVCVCDYIWSYIPLRKRKGRRAVSGPLVHCSHARLLLSLTSCPLLTAFCWHFASVKTGPGDHSLCLTPWLGFLHHSSKLSRTSFFFLVIIFLLVCKALPSFSNCVLSFLFAIMKQHQKMEESA